MVETSAALPQSPSVKGVPAASPSGSGGGALGLGGGDVTFSALRELGGFSPDELEREDFDAAKFVSAARRTVPLDQLCGSLAGHLAELRASLIDAINKDYAAFVGMASSLRGLDKAVSKIRSPVEQLREEVQEVRDAASAQVDLLEEKLEERKSILQAQRRLELLLNAEESLRRMEILFDGNASAPGGGGGGGGGVSDVSCSTLERGACEHARLSGIIRVISDDPSHAKQALSERLTRLGSTLMGQLEAIFGQAIGQGLAVDTDDAALSSCFRAYGLMEADSSCERVVRAALVAPFIDAHVTPEALERGGAPGSCAGLASVYESIITFASSSLLRLCERAKDALGEQSPMSRPDFFLARCLLAEAGPIITSCGGRRVPHYLCDDFPEKYTASLDFIARLEGLCGSRKSAIAFRGHSASTDFLHKWELPLRAHFQLRFQGLADTTSPLLVPPLLLLPAYQEEREKEVKALKRQASQSEGESAAAGAGGLGDIESKPASTAPIAAALRVPLPVPCSSTRAGSEPVFELEATRVVWSCVMGLWDRSLPVHYHRLLQLCLVVACRYEEWVAGWVTFLSSKDKDAIAREDKNSDEASQGGGALRVDEELRVASSMAADCKVLADHFKRELASVLAEKMAGNKVSAHVSAAVQPCVDGISGRIPPAISFIVGILTARSTEPLAAVRAITSQYRMTNKPTPTRPSHYVTGIIAPLKAAVAAGGCLGRLDDQLRSEVLCLVIDKVCGRYVELVEELLANVRRLTQTLKKLNKAREGGADGGVVGDDDKIYAQVRLDVEATDKELSGLGIDTAGCGAMSNLKKLAKEGGSKGGGGGDSVVTPVKKLAEGGGVVLGGLAVGGGVADAVGEEGGGGGGGEAGGEAAVAGGCEGGEKDGAGGVDEAAS